MRLAEHPRLRRLPGRGSNGVRAARDFVEKDYWITEILRTIATTLGERAIFKGGTWRRLAAGLLP